MTDGVDAAVEPVEAAGLGTPMDRAVAVAHRLELPRGHDAMLPTRELGDRVVAWTIELAISAS